MGQLFNDQSHVPGWGADLDPKVRPAGKMWEEPVDGTGAHYEVPEQQPNFRDFHSIERPHHTHVFGTSVPPKGVSGVIRRFAFRYSESNWAHWLGLLFADRVNVVEGIFDDLRRGHVPNVFAEMGIKSEIKHNPRGFAKKVFVIGLIGVGIALLVSSRKSNRVQNLRA